MKYIFLIGLVPFFYSCGGRDQDSSLLSQDEMVTLLCDIHILESKMSNLRTNNADSTRKIYNTFEQAMYESHGIDKSTYERSFEYYMEHPDILEKIYTVVVDSLNVMEQRLMVVAMEAKPNKGSTKKKKTKNWNKKQTDDSDKKGTPRKYRPYKFPKDSVQKVESSTAIKTLP